jgi:hypothetical protein
MFATPHVCGTVLLRYTIVMSWQKQFNNLFTDSFFRFLFGFTTIIAISFGIVIATDVLLTTEASSAQAVQVLN